MFPDDFVWGVSTSSFQIEGSPLTDGAAPSIWYHFSHQPGKIKNNDNADVSCDHYHRYEEDIQIMSSLGIKAYRFSISWSRIVPEHGRINQKGIDFYNRIVDSLCKANIQPFITLFHWDTPVWVENRGGFRSRESIDYICEYGEAVFNNLGDRVKNWITINEPMVYATTGYILGSKAPGRKRDIAGMFSASHHLLLSHARLARLCCDVVKNGKVGIAEAQIYIRPSDPRRERHIRAAALMDQIINRMYIDPIILEGYPKDIMEIAAKYFPKKFELDLTEIKSPCHFIGINYYTAMCYKYSFLTAITHAKEAPFPGAPKSAMWYVYPHGLKKLLLRLKNEYGNPLCYITENGYPLPETHMADPLDDHERITYLRDHLNEAKEAIRSGTKCNGYFLWSVIDNFEWESGYDMRFGIIRVDFRTLNRSWKKSAYWYKKVIESGDSECSF